MENKLTFDSVSFPNGTVLDLACGYVSCNEIVFTNENIIITIESRTGEVKFYNSEHKELLLTVVQTPSSGDERFSEVKCVVVDGQIKLGFPQYTYNDNYPHCDGEHDRWTKTISGFNFLCYDFKNNCIVE